jgi:hypothetical protein
MREILVLLGLILSSAPILADSDGNFCICPDYLAYEFSFSVEPIGHRLYILRFDDPTNWKEPLRLDLPDFNGPPMRCEDQAIVLAGWDAIHHVTWEQGSPASVSLRSEPKAPGPSEVAEFPDTIGSLAFGLPGLPEEYSAALPSDDPVYSYRLTVLRELDKIRPCSWNVRSYVAQYASNAAVDELELFVGQMPAECGE